MHAWKETSWILSTVDTLIHLESLPAAWHNFVWNASGFQRGEGAVAVKDLPHSRTETYPGSEARQALLSDEASMRLFCELFAVDYACIDPGRLYSSCQTTHTGRPNQSPSQSPSHQSSPSPSNQPSQSPSQSPSHPPTDPTAPLASRSDTLEPSTRPTSTPTYRVDQRAESKGFPGTAAAGGGEFQDSAVKWSADKLRPMRPTSAPPWLAMLPVLWKGLAWQ